MKWLFIPSSPKRKKKQVEMMTQTVKWTYNNLFSVVPNINANALFELFHGKIRNTHTKKFRNVLIHWVASLVVVIVVCHHIVLPKRCVLKRGSVCGGFRATILHIVSHTPLPPLIAAVVSYPSLLAWPQSQPGGNNVTGSLTFLDR